MIRGRATDFGDVLPDFLVDLHLSKINKIFKSLWFITGILFVALCYNLVRSILEYTILHGVTFLKIIKMLSVQFMFLIPLFLRQYIRIYPFNVTLIYLSDTHSNLLWNLL